MDEEIGLKEVLIGKHPIRNIALVGLGLVILGVALFPGNKNPIAQTWIAGTGLVLLFFVPFIYCIWNLNRSVNHSMAIVKQGIPDPQTIRLQFIASMGREPTVEEVAGIQQMAKTNHNQALAELCIAGAAVAGGVYLLRHPLIK